MSLKVRRALICLFCCFVSLLSTVPAIAQETTLVERTSTHRIGNHFLRDLSEAQVNEKTRELNARIIDIEVVSTSPMRFDVSLVKEGGPHRGDWGWFYDMSADGLNRRLSDANARPIDIEVYQKNGRTRFAAVIKANTGSAKTDWFWYHSQSPSSLNEKFDRHKMRPIDIERYRKDGQTQYAVIMVDNRGAKKTDWFWYHSQSKDEVLAKMKRHKMRLLDIDRYGNASNPNHVIILTPYSHSTQYSWWYHGLSATQIATMLRRHSARLIDIERQGSDRFNVVMLDNGISQIGHCGGRLKSYADTLTKLMKYNDLPGGQISVTHKGRLVFSCGLGVADLNSLEKVTPENRFRIMSVSKLITKAAIEQMIADGKFSANDRMLTVLKNRAPDFPYEDPRVQTIEVQHLLDHESGFVRSDPDDPDIFDPMTNHFKASAESGLPMPISCRDLMTYSVQNFDLKFWPGLVSPEIEERYTGSQRYSNLGYCILQQIIAANNPNSYAKYVRNKILSPAGVKNMAIGQGRKAKRKEGEVAYYDIPFTPKRRSPYPQDSEDMPPPYTLVVEAMAGHGGWISTTNDLVRFGSRTNSSSHEGAHIGTRSILWRKDDTYIAISVNASATGHSNVDLLGSSAPIRTNGMKFSLSDFAKHLYDNTDAWPNRDLWTEYGYE